MVNGITIRHIDSSELEELLALYKHLHGLQELVRDDNLYTLWEEMLADRNMHILIIEEDHRLVSSCVLVIIRNLTRGGRPYAIIENVVTHSDYRLKGYGKAIITEALDVAWKNNCYKVMLMTGRSDEGTMKFYENCGFVRGVKTGFIAYPH
ncbi:GNAT family N-acetyltransferase [Alicyclobacillus fodiniaquatilis]|uniref:GNAT family N-acetyltransferase n=1 Tax=Alicyclobacillus fodiniaquatilis TaxID=1661150 RepID=A0ABW4JM25_9BACL